VRVSDVAAFADKAAAGPTRSAESSTVQFGVIVFLASDVMLFAPFFAAYFLLRSTTDRWPPEDVELAVGRTAVATAVLVASSFTMVASHRTGLSSDGRRAMRWWLLATIALGAIFLANQIAEYATLDFRADDHPYGSIYWLLTGLHGAHVTAGLGALAILYVRSVRARSDESVGIWAEGVSLFWHLVDIIWLFVFATIWVLQ
jgi:cytochrome c oxidase subunit III